MEKTMSTLKQWLKNNGKKIRELKYLHKKYQRKGYNFSGIDYEGYCKFCDNIVYLNDLRREYRHRHIAYSELRGKTREQIESSYPYHWQPKWRWPNEDKIKLIKREYGPNSAHGRMVEGGGL